MLLKKLEDILIKRLTLGGLTPGELEDGNYFLVQNIGALGMSTWYSKDWGWNILTKNLVYKYIHIDKRIHNVGGITTFVIYDIDGCPINQIPSPYINSVCWVFKDRIW